MIRFVAVALLVLLALSGLALALDGEAMMACPSCPSGHTPTIFALCLAVLTIALAFSIAILGWMTYSPAKHPAVRVPTGLFKPPRTI